MSTLLARYLRKHPVVAFINGTASNPTRPYSLIVVQVLGLSQRPVQFIDISRRQKLVQSLRAINDWPLFPQVFIAGEFIGGTDVLCELQRSGELRELIEQAHLRQFK